MSHDRLIFQQPAVFHQRGAGLPMAIFLITAMALIVATIVQLQESSGEMEALDVLSTRAFYAAESGAQAGLSQALSNNPAECALVTVGKIEFNEAGLRGCSTDVTCGSSGAAVRITSEATCGSGTVEAARTVEVTAQ